MATVRDGDSNSHAVDDQTPLLKIATHTTSSWGERLAQSFSDWFSWELVSAITAISSFAVIVIVLAVFDGSPLPDWPSLFTINSIVSLFTTFAKLSFMSVVGASISQSKWLWYRQQPRSLQDIQLFDEASRGPWGAAALIAAFKTNTLASLGSTVVILSLLFGPFVQQAVSYGDMLVQDSDKDASIVRAQKYLASSKEGLPLPSVVDLSMKAAIYNGVFDASNQAKSGTEHHCSTGNCTFDNFASLAVESTCVNITDMVEKSCNSTGCFELSIPGGPSISGFGGQINTSVTSISSELEEYEASVLRFSTLYSKQLNDSHDALAWECSLYYCVNEYSATVNDGNFLQTVETTWRNNTASLHQSGDLIYTPPSSVINITANSSAFFVDHLAAKALHRFMSSAFTGNGGIQDPDSGSHFSSDVIHALYETDYLPARIANLAVSMSNNIRQQNDSGSYPFQGKAMKGKTFLEVRWPWLAYPVILLGVSMIYLFIIIVQTRKGELLVWKSSTLALLFHGQQLDLGGHDSMPADTLSYMSEKASRMNVDLSQTDGGEWRLAQR